MSDSKYFSTEVISINGVINLAWTAVCEIRERVKMLDENDAQRKRIEQQANLLAQIADDLTASKIGGFSQSCLVCLQNFQVAISECMDVCAKLKAASRVAMFCSVRDNREKMESLEKSMEKAQQNLQLALTVDVGRKIDELVEMVPEGQERAEANALNPYAGIYMGESTGKSRPYAVSRIRVSVKSNFMHVEWTDTRNLDEDIQRYELCFDDGRARNLSCDLQKVQHSTNKAMFTLSLGPPIVCGGRQYAISVRAVNSCGPGEWTRAEPEITRYVTAPAKPKKPEVTPYSATEVIVQTQLLCKEEQRGSPVHQCVVVYNDTNASNRSRIVFDIKHHDRMPIGNLSPNTTYTFRVAMVNEAGESEASEHCQAVTFPLIPGPPQELRVSSKRTSNLLKIRWKEPTVNPQAVSRYQVEMQHASKKRPWKHLKTVDHEKFSATATGLQSGERYHFRVRAYNSKEYCSEFSKVLEAKTRRGKAAQIAAATSAFVGGTLGAPVIGAVYGGVAAGETANENLRNKAKNKAKKVVAAGVGGGVGGAVLGTLGAPLVGGTFAAKAYYNVAGDSDEWSSQSSDDE